MDPTQIEIPANPPEVKLNLAGAPFTIRENEISGSFHPISLSLWSAIIGFHRHIAITHRAESISLHRWHAGEGRYHSLIPHQKSAYGGLYVNYNPTEEENIRLFDEYGRKYREDFFEGVCTIHTHVDSNAFESGTDAGDETDKPGWHITLGRLLTSDQYHMDFRIRIPNVPGVRKYVPADRAYPVEWFNLFTTGTSINSIFKIPGTKDWHHLADRVQPL